jgi:hypothetical protein
VQLRAAFISADDAPRFGDRDPAPVAVSCGVHLTGEAAAALSIARSIASQYGISGIPLDALAIGLVWSPTSGATRALLDESDLDHQELIELLKDELLGG